MPMNEFEHGKTRIMAEASAALRRIGVESHCVMFDLHGSRPAPSGATLTVTVDGNCVSGWFLAEEIEDSNHRILRPEVREKIDGIVARATVGATV